MSRTMIVRTQLLAVCPLLDRDTGARHIGIFWFFRLGLIWIGWCLYLLKNLNTRTSQMKCVCEVFKRLDCPCHEVKIFFTSYFNTDVILIRDNTYINTGLPKNKHEYIHYTLKEMVTVK